MLKRMIKFYPLYFALFPTLSFYIGNQKELQLIAILSPILYSFIFLFLIFGVIKLLVKEANKTNILTLTIILYFFSYGYYWQKIQALRIGFFAFVIYTLIFAGFLILLTKLKKRPELPVFLTIVGLFLIISSLASIVSYEIRRQVRKGQEIVLSDGRLTPVNRNDAPDIYYLILDRYANNQVLREQYHFDNSDFLDFLKDQGFYIAGKSFANYPKTHLSLGSSLNLYYLDELSRKMGEENSDYTSVFALVQNNKVGRFLKASGYRYLYFGDWWGPTSVNKLADRNINLYANSDEFLRKFLQTTLLINLLGDYWSGSRLFGFFADRIWENTNYKFSQLEKIAEEKSPKFIFAHMLFPHYPYIFDKNCLQVDDKRNKPEDEKYLEQLQCANKKVKKMIAAILEKSKKPPIIILQSDEGPFKVDEMRRDGEVIDWTKVSDQAIRRHMRILNAYYLPGFDYQNLYPSVSPVNTFRLVFNYYFGTNFKILPDKSYFIPHIDRPFKYLEITDKVQFKK